MIARLRSLVPGRDDQGESPHPYRAPDPDTAFELLRSRRRRRVVEEVIASDDGSGVDLGILTNAIAIDETPGATDRSGISKRDRKSVYVSLYQVHVPKLETADVVEMTDDNIVFARDGAYALKHLIGEAADLAGERR